MKRLLIILLLALPCHGQMLQAIVGQSAVTSGPVTIPTPIPTPTGTGVNGVPDYVFTRKVTTGANGAGYTATKITVNFVVGGDHWRVGIFTDNAGSPGGGTLVCESAQSAGNAAAGWNDLALPGGCTLSANTVYWLAVVSAGNTNSLDYTADTTNGKYKQIPNSYTNGFTTPFPTPVNNSLMPTAYITATVN